MAIFWHFNQPDNDDNGVSCISVMNHHWRWRWITMLRVWGPDYFVRVWWWWWCISIVWWWWWCIPGKHKMISKLATQSFHILRLIARNPNFLRPKVPYFNVSRLSRLQMAQKWPKMTQSGPKWPKLAQSCPKWPKVAQSGTKWSKVAQSGPKWPKLV